MHQNTLDTSSGTRNFAAEAQHLARRGIDAVRDRSMQLRDQAARAPAATVSYIKHEPVKSALIAGAAAASLLAVGWALWRQRGMH